VQSVPTIFPSRQEVPALYAQGSGGNGVCQTNEKGRRHTTCLAERSTTECGLSVIGSLESMGNASAREINEMIAGQIPADMTSRLLVGRDLERLHLATTPKKR
jgi:hypothetical protein